MKYVAPQTKSSEVELESNFCGSIVDDDKQDESTITIQDQEIGAESNYFDGSGDNQWDF